LAEIFNPLRTVISIGTIRSLGVTWCHFWKKKMKPFVNMCFGKNSFEYNFYYFWTYKSKVMGKWKLRKKSGQGRQMLKPTSKSQPHVPKSRGRKKKENFAKGGSGMGTHAREANDHCLLGHPWLDFYCWSATTGLSHSAN
jgi:hypothetical protein